MAATDGLCGKDCGRFQRKMQSDDSVRFALLSPLLLLLLLLRLLAVATNMATVASCGN